MRILWKILMAGLLLALAACQTQRPATPPELNQERLADGLAPGDGVNRLAAPQSQTRANSGTSSVPEPAPRLGTQWGEDISSSIRFVSLARSRADRPDAQVTIRYDGRRSAAMGPVGWEHRLPVAGGEVEFSVLDARGTPMQLVPTSGGDFHLSGRDGDRYRLAFRNRSRQTIEIVATVDGLDVLNGQPGTIANRGYVVRPGQRLVIDGFRKSEAEVAAFRFSSPDEAYAANTPQGDPRNIGVIGVAVFTLDDPAYDVAAPGPRPFPADETRDPRFAPPPTPTPTP